ncbi:MAG: hypothetical protein ACRDRS_27100 [Pseudonocardiaceae bacterium]
MIRRGSLTGWAGGAAAAVSVATVVTLTLAPSAQAFTGNFYWSNSAQKQTIIKDLKKNKCQNTAGAVGGYFGSPAGHIAIFKNANCVNELEALGPGDRATKSDEEFESVKATD